VHPSHEKRPARGAPHKRPRPARSAVRPAPGAGRPALRATEPKENLKRTRSRSKNERAATPPSVRLFRKLAKVFPSKTSWGSIDRVVGRDFPQLLRWGRTVRVWIGRGYNPRNVSGMLSVFRGGWSAKAGRPAAGLEVLRQAYAEEVSRGG
jgi:hypothetical protein